MPFDITCVPAPQAQNNSQEFGLAAEQEGQALIQSQGAIVILEGKFFDRLRREFNLVEKKGKSEWPQCGTMARIFDRFCETLEFAREGHVACYPQPVFVPDKSNKALEKAYKEATLAIPDSGGLLIEATSSDDATNWVYWWNEDKATKAITEDTLRLMTSRKPVGSEIAQAYALETFIRQINVQALYAFLCHSDSPNGEPSHPGFFTFLTIGRNFTLFRYRKPDDWATIAKKVKKSKIDFESTPVFPEVLMSSEPVLDEEMKSFSEPMLVAFELLRLHVQAKYVQPSFYQPRTTLYLDDIEFHLKGFMEYLVEKVANEGLHTDSEEAKAKEEFPTPPSPANNSPFETPVGYKTPEARPPRRPRGARRQTNPAATTDGNTEENLFAPSGSRPSAQSQPLMRTPPNVDTRQRQRGGRGTAASPESPSERLGGGSRDTRDEFAELMPRLRYSRRPRRAPRGSRNDSLAAELGGVTLESDSDEQANSASE